MAKAIFLKLEKIGELLGRDAEVIVYSDKRWDYPLDLAPQNRNQKDCPMLDVMIAIEKRAGSLIYIPNLLLAELAIAPVAKPAAEPNVEQTEKASEAKKKPVAKKTGRTK